MRWSGRQRDHLHPETRLAIKLPVGPSALRQFLTHQSSAGLVLMGTAFLALVVANSPLREGYEHMLRSYVGPMSVEHWVNDGLMAIFFLLVGLEIKREMLDGQLSSWSRRILPGIAAFGGMVVPAIIFLTFNRGGMADGWAIPAATDIAFALGVLSLLGERVPASLRIFLTALAILDDLAAVLIIALFYTAELNSAYLLAAGALTFLLILMNRFRLLKLAPYLLVGVVLWICLLKSGVHATIAGVVLALTIPMRTSPAIPDNEATSPLHQLEHWLHKPVGFLVLPIFGFANAGVTLIGLPAAALAAPVTLGVGLGLLLGKAIGVFGFAMVAIRCKFASMPAHARPWQLFGISLLCGIGFTMSFFITPLAYPNDPLLQAEAKIGVLAGSFLAGLLGFMVLRLSRRPGVRAAGARICPEA